MIKLCGSVPTNFAQAASFNEVFSQGEQQNLTNVWLPREQPKFGKPGDSCKYNLFFGFFFDGTRNNYTVSDKLEEEKHIQSTHSNVARLYDCYPGQSVPGVLDAKLDWAHKPDMYKHFFKVYIPGVGTEFKQVGDTGKGFWDGQMGAAAANHGGDRLVWALIQAINNVHRFFKQGAMLISDGEAQKLANRIDLDAAGLSALEGPEPVAGDTNRMSQPGQHARQAFAGLLKRLHDAIQVHWVPAGETKPAKLDPGIVQRINVSVFGFSRGATKARVFANWLMALGQLDARLTGQSALHPHTLGGFPFDIEFLGLFDTVASVGLANTMGDSWFGKAMDGHGAWADAERSLRVPDGVNCLHLVSSHEVRRSFPLDSISVKGMYRQGLNEVAFPGVHSDVGGGYMPGEQGKGQAPDGQDMMSRIPLIMMYREARLQGVPLKLELASAKTKERFQLSKQTIADFNAYLDVCKVGKPIADGVPSMASLTDIFREQRKLYIQWRKLRRVGAALPLDKTDSFQRASNFDKNDLHSANQELEAEIKAFETWLANKGSAFKPAHQGPGFDEEHEREWQEIALWWKDPQEVCPAAAARFFDEHVHDSRAWFKLVPGNPDSEDDMKDKLHKWVVRKNNPRPVHRHGEEVRESDGLTPAQRAAAIEFERTRELNIPRMTTEGREPFAGAKAGYLRYRKVYAGADNLLISNNGSSGSSTVARVTEGKASATVPS
jgi:hypothetical protein